MRIALTLSLCVLSAALSSCGSNGSNEKGPHCFSSTVDLFCSCFASTGTDQGSDEREVTTCGSLGVDTGCCADPGYPGSGSCSCAPLDPILGAGCLAGQSQVEQCADNGHLRTSRP